MRDPAAWLWLAVLLAAGPSQAGFNQGLQAYERGDYAAALREFLPVAESGNPAAQFNLGLIYENGLGVPADRHQAVRWYGRAAEGGDADAQLIIGDRLVEGYWGSPDYAEAAEWYRMAAEQGQPVAQRKLGMLYLDGRGVARDADEAANWLEMAADNGEAEAVRWLADRDAEPPPVAKARLRPFTLQLPGPLTEARCREGFPDLPYEVNADIEFSPARVRRDLGISELGQRAFHGPNDRVLGVTEAALGLQSQTQYAAVPVGDGFCFWITSIDVTLRPSALEVYVASEYPEGSCPYRVILAHEQEHVRVTRDSLKRYVPRVRSALASVLIPTAREPRMVASPEAAETEIQSVTRQLLKPVFDEMGRVYHKEQAKLDTPEEYEKLRRQCPEW